MGCAGSRTSPAAEEVRALLLPRRRRRQLRIAPAARPRARQTAAPRRRLQCAMRLRKRRVRTRRRSPTPWRAPEAAANNAKPRVQPIHGRHAASAQTPTPTSSHVVAAVAEDAGEAGEAAEVRGLRAERGGPLRCTNAAELGAPVGRKQALGRGHAGPARPAPAPARWTV